jgi:short-subunit dehydrogenase
MLMGQRRTIAGTRMLITGASQGIGRALAETAAAAGARVLAAARQEALLQELAQQVRAKGGIIETVQADVSSAADRLKMVETAQRYFGGLDVLVNNAGIGATGHFADGGPERLRTIFEVNFFGLTETTRVFLPLLKEGNRPAIVNISSVAAKRGIPARADYSASKFAVQGFSEALRAELVKDGIDVLFAEHDRTQGARAARPSARHDGRRCGSAHVGGDRGGEERGLSDAARKAHCAGEPICPLGRGHHRQTQDTLAVQGGDGGTEAAGEGTPWSGEDATFGCGRLAE